MKQLSRYGMIFTAGGILYCCVELAFRRWTHWTMGIAGGLCFTGMYIINERIGAKHLFLKCSLCSLLITEIEFLAGCLLNIGLKMNIWDYSGNRFHVLGQVCLLFSFLWFLISIPGLWLCSGIARIFQGQKRSCSKN